MEHTKVFKSSSVVCNSTDFDGESIVVRGVVDIARDLEKVCIYRDALYWSCYSVSLRQRIRSSCGIFSFGEI